MIEWFRWWHGTATDTKFLWVAKKSQSTLCEVISVWVVLLEHASNVTQCDAGVTRGDVSTFQCDDWDIKFGFEEGKTYRIFEALEQKGRIKEGRIANWEKRQPKREDSSSERTRAYRDRKNLSSVTQCDAPVTQCDATKRNVTLDTDKDEDTDKDINNDKNHCLVKPGTNGELLPTLSVPGFPPCPHQTIIDLYHEKLPRLPRVAKWTTTRGQHLQARWKEHPNLKLWADFFDIVAESNFLNGGSTFKDGRSFRATLDWLIKPENFAKTIEGKYDNQQRN